MTKIEERVIFMSGFRTYTDEFNRSILETLTNKLSRNGVLTNETYLGQLSEDLRVRVELRYNSCTTNPATGVDVSVISIRHGVIDSHYFDFGLFWAGDSNCRDYWLLKTGWQAKEPNAIQVVDLAKSIDGIVSMYREEYY